ncbi:MAG: J domain-containing protein [Flavobacteriales bacterium]
MATRQLFDHYKVLGVERNATLTEIKKAFRERVKWCHPDRDRTAGANARFLIVHRAYEVLKDPEQRALFDAITFLRQQREAPASMGFRTSQGKTSAPLQQTRIPRFAFYGLHVTGLLFGTSIVIGILIGIIGRGWPAYTALMCLPGLAIIPDSIAGLKVKWRQATGTIQP